MSLSKSLQRVAANGSLLDEPDDTLPSAVRRVLLKAGSQGLTASEIAEATRCNWIELRKSLELAATMGEIVRCGARIEGAESEITFCLSRFAEQN